jgi:uroporphyrinogen-III decarboxylase
MSAVATDRDRLLRVFHQQEVDRIPVAPFIHVNYVKEFFGTHDVDWVVKTPEVYHYFGFDLIHRNCSIAYDPFGRETQNWKLAVTRESEGRDETTTTVIHTPRGELRCRDALRWVYEFDAEVSAVEYPVKSEADFELFRSYQTDLDHVDVSDIERAKQAVGDRGIVAPWIQGAFNLVAIYYRKIDDLLVDALLKPRFYKSMMEYFVGRYKGFVQQIIDAGADVLSYGANVANGKLIGSDFYRENIWPYERDLVAFIQGQGVAVLFHNCGYARMLIPLYSTLDLRAYESLTPPPYGDTALETAVESFGLNTTLAGGVDQLDLLRKGTPQEIDSTVKNILDTVRGKSHFILGTTDYFNENTPRDKIEALAEAGKRHGRL